MIWMHKEIYYTLDEFYEANEGGHWKNEYGDESFTLICGNYNLSFSPIGLDDTYVSSLTTIINSLWFAVRQKYYGEYCYLVEYNWEDEIEPLTETQCKDLLRRFVNIFNLTLPRYLPLLKAYKDNSGDPLKKLSSESNGKTRFNDTPQDDSLNDGYYSDDDHATNVTASVSTTESDPAALYEQLDHLYKNWRSIARDWLDEFRGLFVEGVNLK